MHSRKGSSYYLNLIYILSLFTNIFTCLPIFNCLHIGIYYNHTFNPSIHPFVLLLPFINLSTDKQIQ